MITLPQKIIQILLAENGSLSISEITRILGEKKEAVEGEIHAVKKLVESLGMHLIENSQTLTITASKEVSLLFENEDTKELQKPLSESALQTLSVIIYKPQATKAEIDFIRGVDSSRSLKTLLLRGIITKHESKNKKYYSVTTDTLRYLGVDDETHIPDRETLQKNLTELLSGE